MAKTSLKRIKSMGSKDGMAAISRSSSQNRNMLVDANVSPHQLRRTLQAAAMGDLGSLYSLYLKAEMEGNIGGLVSKRRKAPSRFSFSVRKKDDSIPDLMVDSIRYMLDSWKMRAFVEDLNYGTIHGMRVYRNTTFIKDGIRFFEHPKLIPINFYRQNNILQTSDRERWGRPSLNIDGVNVTKEETPKQNVSWFIVQDNDGFYDTTGVMRPVLKYWIIKSFTVNFWIDYAETYGFPVTVTKMPKALYEEYINEVDEFVRTFGRGKYGVLLEGMDVEIKSINYTGQSDIFKNLLAYCDEQIGTSIFGQPVSTSGANSYANSIGYKRDEREVAVSDAFSIEEFINEYYISEFIKLNFPSFSHDAVVFSFDKPVIEEWDQIRQKWELAGRLGLSVSKSQFQRETGIRIAEKDDAITLSFTLGTSGRTDNLDDNSRENKNDTRQDGGSVSD